MTKKCEKIANFSKIKVKKMYFCQQFVKEANMEFNKENKFFRFFRKFGVYVATAVLVLVVATSITLAAVLQNSQDDNVPVSTKEVSFGIPMTDCSLVKEFSDELLVLNTTMGWYMVHLGIDLTSADNLVYSVLDGTVASVTTDDYEGTVVTINHDDGFVSRYCSLSDDVKVAEGDRVIKGQLIGSASSTMDKESATGAHLHFELLKDDVEVDPINYLDIENK